MVTTSMGNRDGCQGLSIGVGFGGGQAIVCSRLGGSVELWSWILVNIGEAFYQHSPKIQNNTMHQNDRSSIHVRILPHPLF